ncbi:MAG: aldehyde dehydrogenase family protein [Bradymonadaceae bacterium]|nr:aldehyde dehydrogenase family protein [Lujinxingiaceae bacterium]
MLELLNPASGELIQRVETDTQASVAQKFSDAKSAQPAWAARPLTERTAALVKLRDLLSERSESLAATLSLEMGKPISQALGEVRATGDRIDFFVEHVAAALAAETLAESASMVERITREPLGVIANISAWNYPYFVGANVFVPALLTGNAVLYKPSEFATLTGLAIAELLWEAGVPREVFQPVVGAGEVGSLLLDEAVDAVFFTGSYATGKKIAEKVAPRLIHLQLELGGKDPVYVADDVDVVAAAQNLADGPFYNSGQSCCAVERLYVHEAVFDAFVEAFVARVKTFNIGDPRHAETYIGPLARKDQMSVLELQIADALQKGASLLCGGKTIGGKGNFFQPSVLVGVDHSMEIMREESFGPVIGIQCVEDDAEAVALMQDTPYGLTAGVYTKERARAERILESISVGTAYWNCCDRVSPRLPWSGRGHSGVGLTLSVEGIRAFTRPKAWHLRSS